MLSQYKHSTKKRCMEGEKNDLYVSNDMEADTFYLYITPVTKLD